MLKELPKPTLASELEETPLPDPPKKEKQVLQKKAGSIFAVGKKTGTSTTKRRLAKIIEMASLGYTRKQMALELTLIEGKEVTPNAIRTGLYKLRKKGQLSNTEAVLTTQAAPLAAGVIIDKLEAGDKVIALETLKGLGVFKSHSAQKNTGQVAVQALQIVFQDGERAIKMKNTNVVGVPQSGEVIDV